jgi:macrolide transport system ATP-binding/permease protein
LRGARRGTTDRASLPQRSLVVFQAALSLVLLAGAGLLTASLHRLEHQDFGFATNGRISIVVNPLLAGYTPDKLPVLYRQLEDRLGRLPGVRRVGLALYSPLQDQWNGPIYVTGRADSPAHPDNASWDRVSTHFLDALGQPILRGRSFSEHDTSAAPRVAVVNETFARLYLAGANPLGVHFGQDGPASRNDFEIIGVARDAKYYDPDQPVKPMYFLPLAQTLSTSDPRLEAASRYIGSILLETAGFAGGPAAAARRELAAIDPNLTVVGMQMLGDEVGLLFNGERLVATLTSLFAILALALAAIGIYGVTAYAVTQRTNEIGIRMALGADRGRVLLMILRGALGQVLLGLCLGLPLALGGGRLVASQLFGVGSADPLILAAAVGVLITAALCAALLPARRAARTDPLAAVRAE